MPGRKARAMDLRPRGLSEIFERAAVLYRGAFVPFFTVALAAIVPVAILQYAVTVREQPQIDQMMRVLTQPNAMRAGRIPLLDSPGALLAAIGSLLVGYLVLAFAAGAISAGVGRYYAGRRVTFAACYRAALARWPAIVAVFAIAQCALFFIHHRHRRDHDSGCGDRRSGAQRNPGAGAVGADRGAAVNGRGAGNAARTGGLRVLQRRDRGLHRRSSSASHASADM